MKNLIANFILFLSIVFLITCTGKKSENPIKQAEKINEAKFTNGAEEDAERLVEAATNNTYEIMLADTAFDKGSLPEVRKLGEELKKMHLKMGSDLLVLAAKKNVVIPADITNPQKRNMLRVSRKRGLNFDKDLVKHLRNKHEDAIEFYSSMAEETKDPEIKAFATKTLTQVQAHMLIIDRCWDLIKDRKPPKTGVDRGDLR
jgi:putative membrane protein